MKKKAKKAKRCPHTVLDAVKCSLPKGHTGSCTSEAVIVTWDGVEDSCCSQVEVTPARKAA